MTPNIKTTIMPLPVEPQHSVYMMKYSELDNESKSIFDKYSSKCDNKDNIYFEDIALIRAIKKLKESQKEALEKRKCVIFLKNISDIKTQPCETKKHTSVIKDKKQQPPDVEIVYCKATKMNGEKCTAKAKPNCLFCGRHNKTS